MSEALASISRYRYFVKTKLAYFRQNRPTYLCEFLSCLLLAFMGVESLERTGKAIAWSSKETGCEGSARTERGHYLSTAGTNLRTMQRSRLGYSIDAILGLSDQTRPEASEDIRHRREPNGNEPTPEISTPEVEDCEAKTRSSEGDVEQLSPKTINIGESNGNTFFCRCRSFQLPFNYNYVLINYH